MLVASGLGFAATAAALLWRRQRGALSRWATLILLLATSGALALGADRGALMVHRYAIDTLQETPPAGGHDHGAHDHGAHDHGGHDHGDEPRAARNSVGRAARNSEGRLGTAKGG